MSSLVSLLRQAWLQSQLSKAFPNDLQLQGRSLPEPHSQNLAQVSSMLLEDDMPLSHHQLQPCDSIFQELQELLCPDNLSGFESAGKNKLVISSHSDHFLEYAKPSSFNGNHNISGNTLEQMLHELGLQNPELIEMLLNCAWLVSTRHVAEANSMIQTLMQEASPPRNATQRLVCAVVEGLVSRIHCTAPVKPIHPPFEETLSFFKRVTELQPLMRLTFFFINQAILKCCEESNKVHIVDYGVNEGYGFQWPSLIREFGGRLGGPFEMRLTLVDYPSQGSAIKRMEEVGKRLTEYAVFKGVNLRVHVIEDKWENIQASDLKLKAGELLIVNSLFKQQMLMDDGLFLESPRQQWIRKVASMKPKLFTTSIRNVAETTPFLMNRLMEILPYYATMYDVIETCIPDVGDRETFDQLLIRRLLVNVVACEGLERTARAETYKRWHTRLVGEGFQVLPPDVSLLRQCGDIVPSFENSFSSGTDQGWLLLCWKGHITHAMSVWNVC